MSTICLVFDVKHYLSYKAGQGAWFVASGRLRDQPSGLVYSSMDSLRNLLLVALIAKINGTDIWAADVDDALLKAHTQEKVYFIAG
jgi:hypothetical protein